MTVQSRPGTDGYTEADHRRRFTEPPKDSRRGSFERDRARIVHSSALRRLSAKTQVVGPGSDDFVRNRLTHSLEVAQVGRELGAALGCDPDIVDTACLAHDLGHPPFGHNGETALNEIARSIGGFEGNAQTLRLVSRLEPKVVDPATGTPYGLNLTRASLDACTKYPWAKGGGPDPAGAKFGVYADDLATFHWLRGDAPSDGAGRRCLEAQVMDLADDVAYSVHDVEDAVASGRFDPAVLDDPAEVARVVLQAREWYLPTVSDAEIEAAVQRLRQQPAWVEGFDGSHRALAALKDMSSQLIGRFVRAAETATRARYADGRFDVRLTRYAANVVVPRGTVHEIGTLKALAAVYVMTAHERRPVYDRQREVLVELVQLLAERAPGVLDPPYRAGWLDAPDEAGRLRVVIDQTASLTDARAVVWHGDLKGVRH